MTVEILTGPNEDPQFVELVSRVIFGLVNDNFPSEIFVVQIDNWFDHKWLEFSGIGVVYFNNFGLRNTVDAALDEFSQDKITFPPFSPKRVIKEYFFEREVSGDYSLSTIEPPYIHSRRRVRSYRNLHRRIENFTESAVFIWFSSNTQSNRRGCLMVYEVSDSSIHTWYAAFSKEKETWRVLQTKGITREQVQSLTKQDVLQGRT